MGISEEEDRYHRQKLIPEWDHEKFSQAHVLILGVGALGTFVSTNLTLAGIGKVTLVDYDTIELSNLNRQLLFSPEDVGKNKAKVAAQKLKMLNPDVEIKAFPHDMQKLSKMDLQDVTVIAACLDTFRGRRWANSLAVREKLPLVSGGMFGFLGNVQTIIPYKTPCFECQPLISQEKLSQACTPLGETRKKIELEKDEPPIPSVSTLSSIVGGLMSQELIKLIMNIGTPLQNYLFIDGLHSSFTILPLKKNDDCPMCGTKFTVQTQEILAFPNEPIKEFKHRIALALGLADPTLMSKGKILRPEQKLELNEGEKIFVSDERLAKPIALKIKYEK
ncbi:MAG: HesA/MoeB/ThiF family protein [Methanobacteriota archaeon]|nr:MAG: HesA/MoeB/ThiF family protein [Euryarchaeota archaeon]